MSGKTSRRVVLGAAWAAPVITFAATPPQASASCVAKTYHYRPSDYNGNDSRGPRYNVAKLTIVTGSKLVVEFVKDYRNASAINVDGKILLKRDNGFKAGECFEFPLTTCDPKFVQVDGNNTHYYRGGVFR